MPRNRRMKIEVRAMRPTRTQSTLRVLSASTDEAIPNAESTSAVTTEKCPISIIMGEVEGLLHQGFHEVLAGEFDAGAFEFNGHVVFGMFGHDEVGFELMGIGPIALDHGSLTFFEQVRRDAVEGDGIVASPSVNSRSIRVGPGGLSRSPPPPFPPRGLSSDSSPGQTL